MGALAISKAINNLLTEVEKMAAARRLRFRSIKKSSCLSKRRRMHPDLCGLVSDAFYEGRSTTAEVGNQRHVWS